MLSRLWAEPRDWATVEGEWGSCIEVSLGGAIAAAATAADWRWSFWPMAFQVAVETDTASAAQGRNTPRQ